MLPLLPAPRGMTVTDHPEAAWPRNELFDAVEVLSPSTRRVDLTLTRDAYRSWGVPCWVVDPEGDDLVRHGPTPSWAERLTGDDVFPARLVASAA